MGLLNLFSKGTPEVQLLPSGSMTVDRNGEILASTVSSSTSPELLQEIGLHVLALFKSAAATQVPLSRLTLQFASLQITARELRGGAIIFLSPKHSYNVLPQTDKV